MTSKYIMLNGKLVDYDDAKIHVLSPAVAYATSVFEGLRAYYVNDRFLLFRGLEHFDRLNASMRALRFEEQFSPEDLTQQLARLIQANGWRQDVHARVLVMMDGATSMLSRGSAVIAMTAGPFAPNKYLERGLKLGTSTWQRVQESSQPPRIKGTANYSNGRLAMIEADEHGYDMPLMLTRHGTVSETPVASVFMIRRDKIFTPSVTEGILEGITRDSVIQLIADEMGLAVNERPIDRTELYDADEVFMCGTGWEITPVASIDNLALRAGAPGPITREITRHYMDAVRGANPRYAGWIREIDMARQPA
ncbi:branched-chain-amino-acid transaminase [Ensifer sp. YR511]|uniref:branched-chain-amino-acid transaminase n=1 Tax=Ensifer sp. YR511 TaxID=1855294 RepID=UPI000886A26F|nr:branched-chain-amino-acid transaminase [Ensifer sp. YR511]SDN75863.1 branched-chain amino acid aminotransferase [Ensifer sp. YR511]